MTVFKAFLKILNKNKYIVILYTVFLIGFGGFNTKTNENNTSTISNSSHNNKDTTQEKKNEIINELNEEKKEKRITVKELKRQSFLMIVSFAVVVYGIIFYYWPLTGWIMAFENYKPKKGLLGSPFVGMAKFKFLFEDATFIKVIRNTFAMGVINLVTTTIMAVLFAILLNEIRRAWIKKPIQTISYLPHFLSWIVVTSILHVSLSPTGIINDLLLRFGIIKHIVN